MIKVNDRVSLNTPKILDLFNNSENIVRVVPKGQLGHQQRVLYQDVGTEFRFCLNDFEDCQKLIGEEKI